MRKQCIAENLTKSLDDEDAALMNRKQESDTEDTHFARTTIRQQTLGSAAIYPSQRVSCSWRERSKYLGVLANGLNPA